jgi:hypothetical protein
MAGDGEQLTQKRLAEESGVPVSTVGSWATGASLPRDLDQLAAVGAVLARWGAQKPPAPREWSHLMRADEGARGALGDAGPGRLVAELTDPFTLEVHRPVEVDGPAGAGLPVLPPYIKRDHDDSLANAVGQAIGGCSAMAVLVGGSSTGKTRACWEVLGLLPPGWRLWHPYDPTRPEAALAELPHIGPRTVIWLNETQLYLDAPGDAGERVAAALSTLLKDPGREPVLVLGTLWPQHWDDLTSPGPGRAQARSLLEGTDMPVPDAFTESQLQDLYRIADDPRLAAAAASTQDGQITQYLAGVPEVLARYRHAPHAARALIHAAMDVRRLGHHIALPHALLEDAAAAYLTDGQWEDLDEDWLEQALAYTSRRCKGVPGPLTRIRPRPGEAGRTAPPSQTGRAGQTSGPAYRLADYLDQHGRGHRSDLIPPPGFWAAAARHASPADQAILGSAARICGLYRDAAQLSKNAAGHGDPFAAALLVDDFHEFHPTDRRPARWGAAHASLDDPRGVASLLDSLRGVGADEQAAELIARDPAASVALDNPLGVGMLLGSLRRAGADQQAAKLAGRRTGRVSLHPRGVASLLDSLRGAGADEQAAELIARDSAASVALDNPHGVALLLHTLLRAGAGEQVAELLARDPAASVTLDDPHGVAMLLDDLQKAGADEQVAELAERVASRAPLDDLGGVAALLSSLRRAGADQQVTKLAGRLPATARFGLHPEYGRPRYRFGREPDGSPAPAWDWTDLD